MDYFRLTRHPMCAEILVSATGRWQKQLLQLFIRFVLLEFANKRFVFFFNIHIVLVAQKKNTEKHR